jgi:hypothetical protein
MMECIDACNPLPIHSEQEIASIKDAQREDDVEAVELLAFLATASSSASPTVSQKDKEGFDEPEVEIVVESNNKAARPKGRPSPSKKIRSARPKRQRETDGDGEWEDDAEYTFRADDCSDDEYEENKSSPAVHAKTHWSEEDDARLEQAVRQLGGDKGERIRWKTLARELFGREKSGPQCAQRWKRVLNPNLQKGEWSLEEELRLLEYAEQAGCSWSRVAQLMGGTRSDVQCRYWHMRIVASRNTSWSPAEDAALRSAIGEHGENNWEQIYAVMRELKLVSMRVGYIKGNGRTPLEYKNRWELLKKGTAVEYPRARGKTASPAKRPKKSSDQSASPIRAIPSWNMDSDDDDNPIDQSGLLRPVGSTLSAEGSVTNVSVKMDTSPTAPPTEEAASLPVPAVKQESK